jgi:nucleotide-binding universal stress UspA family protein
VTIAVARHDSAEGRAALLHAAKEAAFRGTSLAVLYVVQRDLPEVDQHLEQLTRDLQQLLADGGYEQLEWSLHTATDEDTRAATLVRLVEASSADLLVLGSRRRTPIGKFLLGGTVQRVILDSPVPVLVVKAPQREKMR